MGVTLIKKINDNEYICEKEGVFSHRITEAEARGAKRDAEIEDLKSLKPAVATMADKLHELAKTVKEIQKGKAVWFDRVIWLIILLFITWVFKSVVDNKNISIPKDFPIEYKK